MKLGGSIVCTPWSAVMSEIRRYPVGMSLEALAGAWARTEHGEHGSVVVIANEIAGRLRGGVPWRLGEPDGLMMAMILRPKISPLQEALLWLSVSLAATQACDAAASGEHAALWPDGVERESDGERCCYTNVSVQLGPGRVEHAILSVRADLAKLEVTHEDLLSALMPSIKSTVSLLESDPLALINSFSDRCTMVNRQVKVRLLPRGQARGRVAAIGPEGFMVLESATGMLERVAPASLHSVEVL